MYEAQINKSEKKRIGILDALRGIAICGMVLHHAVVSFEIVFSVQLDILQSPAFLCLQLIFVAIFLLVSGICTNLGKHLVRRGLIVTAAALLVSLVTAAVLPAIGVRGLEIYFGILHMFGLSMLLYAAIRKCLACVPAAAGAVISLILFIAYYIFYLNAPLVDGYWLLLFGLVPYGFYSADYYPLLPFFFLFLCGTFVGRYVAEGKMNDWFYSFRLKPFEFIGRHPLLIYLLHQAVIFGVLSLISYLIN